MLEDIIKALRARKDIKDWAVRHVSTQGAQLYSVPTGIEAQRSAGGERYVVEVLRDTLLPDGTPSVGNGTITLLPGNDIGAALDTVTLTAGLVHNPPYTLPGPATFPDVPLADAELQADLPGCLEGIYKRLTACAESYPDVRITASECFGDEETEHLVNSHGFDADQVSTRLHLEAVFLANDGKQEVESFVELNRRRAADLQVERVVSFNAQAALDLLKAGPAPTFEGAVVLRDEALATYMSGDTLTGGVLQRMASGAAKFGQQTTWETGKSIFRSEVTGDPLNIWANRQLPYGNHSNRFDEDGLPAQRLPLVQDNKLAAFSAGQAYATYLNIPATGRFGNVEVAAGYTSAVDLLDIPHVEVVRFSWFNPDIMTGEFATEIRFGYIFDGKRRIPFKGGLLVGNWIDALGAARWSAETGFYGTYQGPTTVQFANLKVAGE